jgi:Fe-S-cluster containining protein
LYNKEFRKRKHHLGDAAEDFDSFADAFKDMRCVFLYENRCLVYEDRPLMCRLTASRNSRTCKGNLSLPEDYEEKASTLLMDMFALSSEYSKLYYEDSTILSLPFRMLG